MLRAIGMWIFFSSVLGRSTTLIADPLLPNALGQLGGRGHGQGHRYHQSADDDESPDGGGVVAVQVENNTHNQGADDPRRNGAPLQKAQDSPAGPGAEHNAADGATHGNQAAEADAESQRG